MLRKIIAENAKSKGVAPAAPVAKASAPAAPVAELAKMQATVPVKKMRLSSKYLSAEDEQKIIRGDDKAPVDPRTHIGSHLEDDGTWPSPTQLDLSLDPTAFMITVVHVAMCGMTEVLCLFIKMLTCCV